MCRMLHSQLRIFEAIHIETDLLVLRLITFHNQHVAYKW